MITEPDSTDAPNEPPRGPRGRSPAERIAPLWRRSAAFFVDLAILALPIALLTWIWLRLFQVQLPAANLPTLDYLVQVHFHGDPLWRGGAVFLASVIAAYFLLFHILAQATPGMRLLALRVVDGAGNQPGVGTCTTRIAASGISAAYFGLGFAWIAFDTDRQAFHDKVAGTFVIHRPKGP